MIFPVSRIRNDLKKFISNCRVGESTAAYLSGVLECTLRHLVIYSNQIRTIWEEPFITPRHILWALRTNLELDTLTKSVIIPREI